MKEINSYWKQLSSEEIAAGEHKNFVGGLWEEIGSLQFEFMKSVGLLPNHHFLDVGCGALRGGLFFIKYLDKGNYSGVDINASLIEAGKSELQKSALTYRDPHLLVNDKFEVSALGRKFDFALALSLFTHLYSNNIIRCLVEVCRVLHFDGRFYATFFEAPFPAHLNSIHHSPGSVTTNFDSDPFHYSFDEIKYMALIAKMEVQYISEWNHPRGQKMLCFTPAK